jgi:hypothetical protein
MIAGRRSSMGMFGWFTDRPNHAKRESALTSGASDPALPRTEEPKRQDWSNYLNYHASSVNAYNER